VVQTRSPMLSSLPALIFFCDERQNCSNSNTFPTPHHLSPVSSHRLLSPFFFHGFQKTILERAEVPLFRRFGFLSDRQTLLSHRERNPPGFCANGFDPSRRRFRPLFSRPVRFPAWTPEKAKPSLSTFGTRIPLSWSCGTVSV